MNMKQILLISLSVIALLLLVILPEHKKADLSTSNNQNKSMNALDFQSYLENSSPTIIDVRTPEEFASGHISGATNINFYDPDFTNRISSLDPSKEYAIYCRSGNRSSSAIKIMSELGFTKVVELTGGIIAWERAGQKSCSNGIVCYLLKDT